MAAKCTVGPLARPDAAQVVHAGQGVAPMRWGSVKSTPIRRVWQPVELTRPRSGGLRQPPMPPLERDHPRPAPSPQEMVGLRSNPAAATTSVSEHITFSTKSALTHVERPQQKKKKNAKKCAISEHKLAPRALPAGIFSITRLPLVPLSRIVLRRLRDPRCSVIPLAFPRSCEAHPLAA